MGSLGGLSPGGSIAVRTAGASDLGRAWPRLTNVHLLQVGIIVGLMSTSVQSLGLTLQRKSHILEDEKPPHDNRRPPYRRRRWQIGMGMFIISNILGSTVQISTLPLPVLSTLQASGLVFNSICATLILGEPFTRWSIWGTLFVCSGAVLIAIFGAIPSPTHSLDELLVLLGRWPFVLWMSLQAALVIAIAAGAELTDRFSTWSQSPRFLLTRGLAYGCISGILSAHSLLVAKSAVELVLKTITDKNNQFNRWQSWMLLVALVTLALSQLYYLHRGLKLVSTSVLYPLVFCIYNIIAILDGLIYFQQTDQISVLDACLISLGTVVLLSGVLALSWRLHDEQHSPGVGQSSLAPGLGMVEDTEGEEEEEELLLGSDIAEDEESVIPRQYSYQTFQANGSEALPEETELPKTPLRRKSFAPSMKTATSRRVESAEIWDELEDQDQLSSSIPGLTRRRSSTLPALGEAAALLPSRRITSSGVPYAHGTSGSGPGSNDPLPDNRALRRRRRSTGFPGFQARKSVRKARAATGLQDAIGGIWKMRWWTKNKDKLASASRADPNNPRWSDYRDAPVVDDDSTDVLQGETRDVSESSSRKPKPGPGDDAIV